MGLKFFYTLSFQKCLFAFCLFVSIHVSDAYVEVLSVIVFLSLNSYIAFRIIVLLIKKYPNV